MLFLDFTLKINIILRLTSCAYTRVRARTSLCAFDFSNYFFFMIQRREIRRNTKFPMIALEPMAHNEIVVKIEFHNEEKEKCKDAQNSQMLMTNRFILQ